MLKIRYSILILLAALLFTQCVSSKKTVKKEAPIQEEAATEEKKPDSKNPISSTLLQTFEISRESSLAFFKVGKPDTAIGPLKKGEIVKKLDLKSRWMRVWIPRLRVSAWVSQEDISPSSQVETSETFLPLHDLTTVELSGKEVNIREEPSIDSALIIQTGAPQKYHLLSEKEGWFQVWLEELERNGWFFEKSEEILRSQKDIQETKTEVSVNQIPSDFLSGYIVVSATCQVLREAGKVETSLTSIKNGEVLKKLEIRSEWMRVWVPGLKISGWVPAADVYQDNESTLGQGPVPMNLLSSVKVIKSRVNVRDKPSVRSKIIHVAKEKEEYPVLNQKKGWYEIWLSEFQKSGWIYEKLVKKD